jgi:hypothetical protein
MSDFINSADEYLGMGVQEMEGQRKKTEADKVRAEQILEERRTEKAKADSSERLLEQARVEGKMKDEIIEIFLEANPNYNHIQAKVIYDRLREVVAMERFKRAMFPDSESSYNYPQM